MEIALETREKTELEKSTLSDRKIKTATQTLISHILKIAPLFTLLIIFSVFGSHCKTKIWLY